MSDSMNSAISEFVLNRAQLMKRDPADCIWMGDLVSAFINSQEYAQMAISSAVKMSFSVQELRPEVMAFALLMEARLREKDADKGQGWKRKSDIDLTVNVCTAARQIEQALFPHKGERSVKALVDMSNHCMMLADVLGTLEAPVLERKADNGGVGWVGLDQVQMP